MFNELVSENILYEWFKIIDFLIDKTCCKNIDKSIYNYSCDLEMKMGYVSYTLYHLSFYLSMTHLFPCF